MDSNIIKFTSISEGESSYSIELSMPFIGISVDGENKPASGVTYKCDVAVMRGSTQILPSNTPTAGTFKLELVTTSVSGLKNITADNSAGRITFTADIHNALDDGSIEFLVYLESSSNAIRKSIGFSPLQGLHGSDGLTYSFDYDNGTLVKFKNGSQFEYTPKVFRIAGFRRQGAEAREKLTNTDYHLSAVITVNSIEVSMPVSWDSANQVYFISFADNTMITVGSYTDYITQFNIRKLDINVYDASNQLIDHMSHDVNYGTSDDAASLILNPTSIIGAIQNTKINFDSEGLDIFHGGLRIYRGSTTSTEKVFETDQNGNLTVRGSIKNGSDMAGWEIREHTMISGSGQVGIGDGHLYSPAGDYSFWAGHENPDEAPFSVKKDGHIVATYLEIGGTQITPGTIRTGALAPGSVTNGILAENAVDSVNIREGAIITDHLYANAVTADKLAADVGQSLDLSSNTSINLIAGDLRDEVIFRSENACGQAMTMVFTNGNAFEYGKSNLVAEAHVWKNGVDVTEYIPDTAFLWQRDSDDRQGDIAWNQRADHRNTKTITIPREEIGKSCVIRCACEEANVPTELIHNDNGDVVIDFESDIERSMFISEDGDLFCDDEMFKMWDDFLMQYTYSDYMQVESTVFDHSMLQSSHITIKDEKIDIDSGGDLNLLAGADINVKATANINVEANGNIVVKNGGNMNVESGGDINITSGGKLKVQAQDIVLNASQQTTLEDELDGVGERLDAAELKITPTAIVSTVRQSTQYQQDLNAKANSADVSTSLTTLSQTLESEITQTAGEINQRVTNVQTQVGNIAVGGRNLLLNSADVKANNDYMIASYTPSMILTDGEEYTATICVQPAPNVTAFRLYLSGGYAQQCTFNVSGTSRQIISQTFTAHYYTGRVPSSPTDSNARANFYRFPNNGTVVSSSYIFWVKIEKGNKPTDWTPAPEDTAMDIADLNEGLDAVVTRVSEAELKITDSAIVSTVRNSTEYKGDLNAKANSSALGSYVLKTEFSSQITQNATSIVSTVRSSTQYTQDLASKGSASDVSNLKTRMSNAETSITQQADAIELRATKTSVNNIVNGTTAVGKVETSAVTINSSGITMKSGSSTKMNILPSGIYMYSGELYLSASASLTMNSGGTVKIFGRDDASYIKFGGSVDNPNFSLGNGGWITAKGITTDELYVRNSNLCMALAGSLATRFYCGSSSNRPSSHGYIWFEPASISSLDYSRVIQDSESAPTFNGYTPTNTLIFTKSGVALAGTNCTYGVFFRIYNWNGSCTVNSVQIYLERTDGLGSSVLIYNNSRFNTYVGNESYLTVNTLLSPSGEVANLTSFTQLQLRITLGKSASTSMRFEKGETFTIRAQNNSSSTAQLCNVYYVP